MFGGRWIPIRPQTDAALALAIMYVWVTEGRYDNDYVAKRSTGFDEWKAYLTGEDDGTPKTPDQQHESELLSGAIREVARRRCVPRPARGVRTQP